MHTTVLAKAVLHQLFKFLRLVRHILPYTAGANTVRHPGSERLSGLPSAGGVSLDHRWDYPEDLSLQEQMPYQFPQRQDDGGDVHLPTDRTGGLSQRILRLREALQQNTYM